MSNGRNNQGYSNINGQGGGHPNGSEEEFPGLPQPPQQAAHAASGGNSPPTMDPGSYVPNSRFNQYTGYDESQHAYSQAPQFTDESMSLSHYTQGGQVNPQFTVSQYQQEHQQQPQPAYQQHEEPQDLFTAQPTSYADTIPLSNIDTPPAGRPLPQEPVFGGTTNMTANNTGFQDTLHPTRTGFSYTSSAHHDPFDENPFDGADADSALQYALNANNSSQNLNAGQYSAAGNDRLNIPLSMQDTSYVSSYQGGSGGSGGDSNAQSNSNLAGIFQEKPGYAVEGDSYVVRPLPTAVTIYDNQMNPVSLGPSDRTGTSTADLFNQGVFVSQNIGQGIDQSLQNQIQGRFEQDNGAQFSEDPQSQYLLAQQQEGEEEQQAIREEGLFLGNLTLDCPIPTKLAAKYKVGLDQSRQASEFIRMRYTAVTSEPEQFAFDKFTLRQQLFKRPRTLGNCAMMIVVTMYNEDDILLGRTLKGIFDNLKYICSKGDREFWGPEGWKKVVVAIVSDGRTKINPRSRALLANLGVYQEGFAKSKIIEKDVTCHLYEHTTLANIASVTDKVNLEYDDIVPVQLIFALKEKNQKKINSHRWCFQALAPLLDPEVIVLFDAGTEPTKKSIYKLWREFYLHPNVGGACGEIKAMLGPRGKFLYNSFFGGLLVAGQNFEYKMSNILDKPTESVFGFISVLPGAFSAYRFEALKNDSVTGHGPLEAYFKGETLHQSEEKHDLFANNMYLAEDRILCFEIVTKRNSNWVLRYVNTAAAATDVPDQLPEFISQRRRWLNGSFFAAVYSIVHFGKIYRSNHSFLRKILLQMEFVYNMINIIISWFSVGSFFLVFRILTLALSSHDSIMYFKPGKAIAIILLWLYLVCTMSVFIFAFGNKPKGTKKAYWVVTLIYGVMMGYMIFCAVWLSVKSIKTVISDGKSDGHLTSLDFIKNATFRDLVVSMGSTYVLYIVSSVLYGQPWHMLTSFIQYLLLSPAYINILNIYAFCNIHDISWGTKGDDGFAASLGTVKKSESGGLVMDYPTTPEEVDEHFLKEQDLISTVPGQEAEELKTLDEQQRQEKERKKRLADEKGDYYQFVRSMVVLVWCISNGVLIALVMNIGGAPSSKNVSDDDPTGGTNATTYLTVILWLVAVLAGIRFIGSMSYLATRIFGNRRLKVKTT